jgi:hypothetical protein
MQCESCDDAMEYEIIAVEVLVANRRVSVDQPGWYCWSCKLATHSATNLSGIDDALSALLGKRCQLRPGKAAPARRG